MTKKTYTKENEMLSILTPPNETYNGKQIPVVVSTTKGVFVQSGQNIKNIQFKGTTKIQNNEISKQIPLRNNGEEIKENRRAK